MNHRSRRIVLALLVSLLVVAAGCSALQAEKDPSSRLLLVNQDSIDHAVVVEISDESGLVYSDGRTVAEESDLDLDAFEEAGEFEVAVTVDGETTAVTHRFERDERVTNIGIDNDGVVTVE